MEWRYSPVHYNHGPGVVGAGVIAFLSVRRMKSGNRNMRWMNALWLVAMLLAGAALAATDGRTERLQLTGKETKRVLNGSLRGREYIDYRLPAGAGQTLTVTLKTGNGQNYFNVTAPGSEWAMFVGSSDGRHFSRRLPADGDYVIRVYLMRAAARRDEGAQYALTVSLDGKALRPLPASRDALVPGTRYHATSTLSCSRRNAPEVTRCDSGVIRRTEGAATVELRWPDRLRRVLFAGGKAVASDGPEILTQERRDDMTTVRFGDDDAAVIPDAMVGGG